MCVCVCLFECVCVAAWRRPYEHTLSHRHTDTVTSLSNGWRHKACVCLFVCVSVAAWRRPYEHTPSHRNTDTLTSLSTVSGGTKRVCVFVFVFVSVSVCVCCCAAPSYEHTLSHSNTDTVTSLNSKWRDKVCVCVCGAKWCLTCERPDRCIYSIMGGRSLYCLHFGFSQFTGPKAYSWKFVPVQLG